MEIIHKFFEYDNTPNILLYSNNFKTNIILNINKYLNIESNKNITSF